MILKKEDAEFERNPSAYVNIELEKDKGKKEEGDEEAPAEPEAEAPKEAEKPAEK